MPKKPQPKKTPSKEMKQLFNEAVEETLPVEPRPARIEQPPMEDVEDGDLYEPYAPQPGEVPLAAGETQETAPQPGDWKTPDIKLPTAQEQPETPKQADEEEPSTAEMALDPKADTSEPLFGNVTADYLAKWLGYGIDAIEWLVKQNRRIQPKDKTILEARVAKLRSIKKQIP